MYKKFRRMNKVIEFGENEEENDFSSLNILNCSLSGKRECAKDPELPKEQLPKKFKTEKAIKSNRKFRKKFSGIDRVLTEQIGVKKPSQVCHPTDYLSSVQPNDVNQPEKFVKCPVDDSLAVDNSLAVDDSLALDHKLTGELESDHDYLLEDDCKENDIIQLNLESSVSTNPSDNVTIDADIGENCQQEQLGTDEKSNQGKAEHTNRKKIDFQEDYGKNELENDHFDGENFLKDHKDFLKDEGCFLNDKNEACFLKDKDESCFLKDKDESYFLFKNEEMLVKCEDQSAPNEDHLVLNNLMLSDQSDDYSFQSDAFNKSDYDVDRAGCFDYAEIGFGCGNLGYANGCEEPVKVDEKSRMPPKSSVDEVQSLNQMNYLTLQQNLSDYKANLSDYKNRSASIVDPGKFPTYANTGDLAVLESHLNGNFQPNTDNPNEASNESINNLDLIESPDYLTVDGLQLNETLLNALLSNQQLIAGNQLNGISSNGSTMNSSPLNGNPSNSTLNILRKNKMVSSCLSSIGNSISGRLPLSGELIGRSEMKCEVKLSAPLTGLDRPESDCSNKLNSISIKLAENDDGPTNVLFAGNLDDYLLLSSAAETSPVFENGSGAIRETETHLATETNATIRKRPSKPNEQILQLTNSLSMPISSPNCLNLSTNHLNSSNFLPLNSPSASSDSNCLNLLYSLANNISNNIGNSIGNSIGNNNNNICNSRFTPTVIQQTLNCSKAIEIIDDANQMRTLNQPESSNNRQGSSQGKNLANSLGNSLAISPGNSLIKSKNSKSSSSCNPFSIECRIPLPNTLASDHSILVDKNFIKRRNQRERIRVKSVNDGFDRLRKHLPVDYEQYLDLQGGYSSCYLKNSANLNSSTNSTTDDLDLKCSLYTAFSSNEPYLEHYAEDGATLDQTLDRKPLKNALKEQTSIGYSNSSSSSSTTSVSSNKERRLSKVETLRLAINYIKHLENVLSS